MCLIPLIEGFAEGQRARIISTNLAGNTNKDFIRQFERNAEQRPDIKQPVSKIKINFKPEEKLIGDQLMEIVNDYRQTMRLEDCPFIAVEHRDTKHQHLHLVFSMIDFDGNVVRNKFDRLEARKWANEIEEKYSLTATPMRTKKRGMTCEEADKASRTNVYPLHVQLQNEIDQVIHYPAVDFVQKLEEKNIGVMFRFEKEKAVGISFAFGGKKFAGGKLGSDYNWNGLQERGVTYETLFDNEQLLEASLRAKEKFANSKPNSSQEINEVKIVQNSLPNNTINKNEPKPNVAEMNSSSDSLKKEIVFNEEKANALEKYNRLVESHIQRVNESRYEDFAIIHQESFQTADFLTQQRLNKFNSKTPDQTQAYWQETYRETYQEKFALTQSWRNNRRESDIQQSLEISKIYYQAEPLEEVLYQQNIEQIKNSTNESKVAFLVNKTCDAYTTWKEVEDLGKDYLLPRETRLIEYLFERQINMPVQSVTDERLSQIADAQQMKIPDFSSQLDANFWVVNNLPDYGSQLLLENMIENIQPKMDQVLEQMNKTQAQEVMEMISQQNQINNFDLNQNGWQKLSQMINQSSQTLTDGLITSTDNPSQNQNNIPRISDLDEIHSALAKGDDATRGEIISGLVSVAKKRVEENEKQSELDEIKSRFYEEEMASEQTFQM